MLHRIEKKDSYLHKGLRQKLIDELKRKGITAEIVLDAINKIPRHFFLDPAFQEIAYEDRAFPIAADQTISQPYTVAYQTQLLDIQPFDKVLEIGTGSAYQACVLAEMGARVFTIERQKKLFDYNKDFFFLRNYPQIKRFYGDGFKGLPSFAPFDKIIITAAAPYIPDLLLNQLKVKGMMVLPVNTSDVAIQQMVRLTRTTTGYEEETFDQFCFVPMLTGKKQQ